MTIKDALTWLSIGVQAGAAILWFASTMVKVSAAKVEADYQKIHGPQSGPFQIITDGNDFIETAQRQGRWSGWAAMATGAGIGLQAIATALPA